jgi:arylsulfatase A-like enzyme
MIVYAIADLVLAWAVADRVGRRDAHAHGWLRRAGVLVPALGLLAHLRTTSSPIDARTWQLATKTVAAGELLRTTGSLAGGFDRLRASLVESPAGREGAAAAEAARAWNSEHVGAATRVRSVVLITVDTLRYDHVGYSGATPPGLTPNLDALAERSARFHRAYAQGGWTSLSIPSLMWSRQPEHIAFERVFEDARFQLHFENEVDPEARFPRAFQSPRSEPSPSLAEVLSKSGVTTLAVTNDGFTHYFEPRLGMVRGFADARHPRETLASRDPDAVPFEIPDALAVDLALDLLDEHRDEPSLLWVHLFGSHEPYERWPDADESWTDYQSEVHTVDREIGRLLLGLAARGRDSDTAIIVTGDHGEGLFDHGSRGHGLDAYEEGIRVPLLIAMPDAAAGGGPRDIDVPVGLIDLAPTISAMLGVRDVPASFEGFDLGPALRAEAFSRPPVLSETWRLPVRGRHRNPHLLTVIDGDSKVVIDLRTSTLAFFDLERDPDERTNLTATVSPDERDAFLRLAGFGLGVHDRPQ